MALISCPECGKEVSDKAVSCPNCGMGNSLIRKTLVPEYKSTRWQYYLKFIGVVFLVMGIIGCVYCLWNFTWVDKLELYNASTSVDLSKVGKYVQTKGISFEGLTLAISSLFSGMLFHAITWGIAKIINKSV